MKPHIRIEKPDVSSAGAVHVVTNDKILAVGADGTTVDISPGCQQWVETSKAGEARVLTITMLCFDIHGGHGYEPDEATAIGERAEDPPSPFDMPAMEERDPPLLGRRK